MVHHEHRVLFEGLDFLYWLQNLQRTVRACLAGLLERLLEWLLKSPAKQGAATSSEASEPCGSRRLELFGGARARKTGSAWLLLIESRCYPREGEVDGGCRAPLH